jgi:hypothetical protein
MPWPRTSAVVAGSLAAALALSLNAAATAGDLD